MCDRIKEIKDEESGLKNSKWEESQQILGFSGCLEVN